MSAPYPSTYNRAPGSAANDPEGTLTASLQRQGVSMPKGTPPITPRHTEEVARETTLDLAWECMKLMRSTEPQAWETAAQKFDECADACRIAEAALTRRKATQVLRPECPIRVVEVCMYDSIPHLLAAMQTRRTR